MSSPRADGHKACMTAGILVLLLGIALSPAGAETLQLGGNQETAANCLQDASSPKLDGKPCEPPTDARTLGQDRSRPGQRPSDDDQERWRAFYGRDYNPLESPGYGSSGRPEHEGDGDGR